jgi:hypothetical protein
MFLRKFGERLPDGTLLIPEVRIFRSHTRETLRFNFRIYFSYVKQAANHLNPTESTLHLQTLTA